MRWPALAGSSWEKDHMFIALWVASGFLALVYFMAGATKAFSSKETLDNRMAWSSTWKPGNVTLLGVVEMLGAVGLIVPELTHIAPILTPIAAVCFAVVAALSIRLHASRGETNLIPFNVVLLLVSIFVAVGRFTQG